MYCQVQESGKGKGKGVEGETSSGVSSTQFLSARHIELASIVSQTPISMCGVLIPAVRTVPRPARTSSPTPSFLAVLFPGWKELPLFFLNSFTPCLTDACLSLTDPSVRAAF